MRRPRVAAACGVLALGLAGCSGSVSPGGDDAPGIGRAEVEQEVTTRLGSEIGRVPEDVSCPGDLVAEPGETMRCTLSDAGTTVGVIVTVIGVDGEDVTFGVEVDEE